MSEVRIFLGAQQHVTDDDWMREALVLADRAAALGEVPVGAVVVAPDGARIGEGFNLREAEQDPTAHAEMIAVRAAARGLGSWRLEDCTLFVTLEPCAMCAGALVHARVARVVWGCDDPKGGACKTLFTIGQDPRLNHRFVMTPGVLAEDCAGRLRQFFADLRALGRK